MTTCKAFLFAIFLLINFSNDHAHSEGKENLDTVSKTSNERSFYAGLMLGTQQFTQSMSDGLSGGISPGLILGYAINDLFSAEASYRTSAHSLFLGPTAASSLVVARVGLSSIGLNIKVDLLGSRKSYILNPYFVAGISQNFRTFSLTKTSATAKDNATGHEYGFGFDLPLKNNRMYLGLRATYQFIAYPGEDIEIRDKFDRSTGATLEGDQWNTLFIFGARI